MVKQRMKYGDIENASKDADTLNDIIARQGPQILHEAIAEHIGRTAQTFNLGTEERQRLLTAALEMLKEDILERT